MCIYLEKSIYILHIFIFIFTVYIYISTFPPASLVHPTEKTLWLSNSLSPFPKNNTNIQGTLHSTHLWLNSFRALGVFSSRRFFRIGSDHHEVSAAADWTDCFFGGWRKKEVFFFLKHQKKLPRNCVFWILVEMLEDIGIWWIYMTKIQCPGYPSFKVLCSGLLLNKAQAHMS